MSLNKKIIALSLACLLLGTLSYVIYAVNTDPNRQFAVEENHSPSWVRDDFYNQKVQPIFDAKCIACHACYNSPCQLNLTSYEGIQRGANKKDPYDFPLAIAGNPTRLGQDASSLAEWKDLGFYDVIGKGHDSLLLTLINGKRGEDYQNYPFAAESSRTCLKPGIVPVITLTSREHLSMPYGLPELTAQEKQVLKQWIELGAPGPSEKVQAYLKSAHSDRVISELAHWEKLLNEEKPQNILSARYLYEHLFIAHIHFWANSKEFFRLVRASNLQGPPEEISTDRPFDGIKRKFYYRFKVIDQSLVAKTHITFLLGAKEKERFQQQFLSKSWSVSKEELPGYGSSSANAFVTFKNIPRRVRYQFFLDNARYFIMTFMKGPVCRGQTALNVINDHFWVYFVDPDFDLTAKLDTEFNSFAPLLSPPAVQKDHINVFNDLRRKRWQAHINKMSLYKKLDTDFSLQTIWDGDGHNPNSQLTVYRHFDSSDVVFGAHGGIPKTIWLMDYQIFEDIYYNLVAGYNLYGPILHQLNTRLYMELSRISSEDMFITLLPNELRAPARRLWSQESPVMKKGVIGEFIQLTGTSVTHKMERVFNYQGDKIKSLVNFEQQNSAPAAVKELLTLIQQKRLPSAPSLQYQWDQPYYHDFQARSNALEGQFKEILELTGPFPPGLPDVMLLRLTGAQQEQLITIALNKDHYNVNMLFVEDLRRRPSGDTINILENIVTSYPNFYLEVKINDLASFISEFKSALINPTKKEYIERFFKRYGVSRFSADFWQKHQWFNNYYQKSRPIEYGALDLNRYLPR